ncbi:MAG: ribonuclease III [Thermodesulfobacteriota bacterium]
MTVLESLLSKNHDDLVTFARRLGHRFHDLSLLQEAFVHSSFAFEQGGDLRRDNETLEFLGDAVLDLAVGHALYELYPAMREGELTQLRAAVVQEGQLARMARQIDLGRFLLLGRGEEGSGGRSKDSILSCAFEAVMGAVFLDGGYDAANQVVQGLVVPWFAECRQAMELADAKSRLQELLQHHFSQGPSYELTEASGPDHDKTFTVSVSFQGRVLARGEAKSKKRAEQQAAAQVVADFSAILEELQGQQ